MPRPSKNPNNPIVRLRAELSKIEGCTVTRARLAKRTKIPEPTLRDHELRKLNMTEEISTKIAYATGVNPGCLYDDDKPIVDFDGKPLSKDSPNADQITPTGWFRAKTAAMRQLCEAAWETALEKKVARLIEFSFNRWLAETFHTYGLHPLLAEKLTDRLRLGLFDPAYMEDYFHPSEVDARSQLEKQRLNKLWDEWYSFESQVKQEAHRLYDASGRDPHDQVRKDETPVHKSPKAPLRVRVNKPFDQSRYDACYESALQSVRRQRYGSQPKAKPAVKQPISRRKAA